jgi:hypothetical protein
MDEYKRFYELDDKGPTFAGTDAMFNIGDTVMRMGMEYKINSFYQSHHARPNEVDWIRIERHNGMHQIWADVYPSELQLVSRPVD